MIDTPATDHQRLIDSGLQRNAIDHLLLSSEIKIFQVQTDPEMIYRFPNVCY